MHPWLPYNEFSRRLKWWLGRLIDRMEALEKAFRLLRARVRQLEDDLANFKDEIQKQLEEIIANLEQEIEDAINSFTEKIESILQTIENIQTAITTINNWITEAEKTRIPEIHLSTSSQYAGYVTLGEDLVIEWGRINTQIDTDNYVDLTFEDSQAMAIVLTDTGSSANGAYSGGVFFIGSGSDSTEGHFLISRGINKNGNSADDPDTFDDDNPHGIVTYSWVAFCRRGGGGVVRLQPSYNLLKGVA